MRFFAIFCLLSLSAGAQVMDSFTDGNLNKNPAWKGDTSRYIVNISNELQLNSSASDTAILWLPSSFPINAEWRFWIKMAFSPSNNNYLRVYLLADKTNFKQKLNGFFVQMGENGSFDSIDLWKQTDSSQTKLIDGLKGRCSGTSNTIRVKIIHDSLGNWQLFSDTLGGINYQLEGQINDKDYYNVGYFGIYSRFTSTNAKKFYYDDLYSGPSILDLSPPKLDSLVVKSPSQLDAYFNEPVEALSAQKINNYLVSNGLNNPLTSNRDKTIFNLVHLSFSKTFTASYTYYLQVDSIKDISGNIILKPDSEWFVLPDSLISNDLILNEILPNPKTGGVDFIEVYNRSSKVINLEQLRLSSMDTFSGQLTEIKQVINHNRLFFPGDYILLSNNGTAVKSQYYCPNPETFIDMISMPTMNNDGDIVVIADSWGNIIDKLVYTSAMHFPLLSDTKGVSLERINFNLPTQRNDNWHSAAEAVGFATPGYKNSQFLGEKSNGIIQLSSEIFSPDNDGYQDILSISYSFSSPDFVGTVTIYNSEGQIERKLIKNELLGINGAFSWDGINDEREMSNIGIYIILFEVFDTKGNTFRYKKTCVLAKRL